MRHPTWPAGCRSAALLTVTVDGEQGLLAVDPTLAGRTKTLSTRTYGMRWGVDALAAELARAGFSASWLAPGVVVRDYPDHFRRLAAAGHDFGVRGQSLERFDALAPDERRAALSAAVGAFRSVGIRPTGFRLPGGEWPCGLVADLAGAGLSWSSSWIADDAPFTLAGAAGTSIVEIPRHHVADDAQAFEWNFSPPIPAGHARIASYADVLEDWTSEFEGTREEGLLWVLSLNPHVTGTPGRIGLVRTMLARLRSHDDVWVTTGAEVAAWWARTHAANDPAHPSSVFLAQSGWPHY